MSKLINQQAITRLSQGLHQKAKDLVEAEKNRALAEEGRIEAKVEQNISDIAAINNVETGILKQAKDYVDAAIENVDAGALEDRIEAELLRVPNFGHKCLTELKYVLGLLGLRIKKSYRDKY